VLIKEGKIVDDGLASILFAAVFLLAVGGMVLLLLWRLRRSREVLQRWADREGCTILSSERRFLRRGPFWWRTTDGQDVFYVTVRDAQGRRHTAYVRVGGWFLGLFSDVATVAWQV
jgi:hypothetical protein